MANDNPSAEGIKVKIALQIQPTKFHRLADPIQIPKYHDLSKWMATVLSWLAKMADTKMAPPPRTDYNLLRVANHLRLREEIAFFPKLSEAKALCGRSAAAAAATAATTSTTTFIKTVAIRKKVYPI
ncbi:hypothetical protein CEXT_204511 [Caerostris extrusa]|uniref:Uncharacterized protein n=1 Tax=Caerostris extrusa TaxID=172846 RepID=A0AAV4PB38_CAEEX|nr:hypothetical protein CEXT_204511 [Caerostris extrusa]